MMERGIVVVACTFFPVDPIPVSRLDCHEFDVKSIILPTIDFRDVDDWWSEWSPSDIHLGSSS